MAALRSRCGHYIFVLWFLLSFFLSFFLFSSPNLSDRGLDVYHTSTRLCGLSANLECRSEMRCTRLARNTGRKNDAKIRHLGTITQLCPAVSSQLRYVSTIGRNLLNSNISSICSHNTAIGQLTAEIGSAIWGTPVNFNGFRVLPLLLLRRRSPEANQTLDDLWPSPGLVHYIYIFGGFCP